MEEAKQRRESMRASKIKCKMCGKVLTPEELDESFEQQDQNLCSKDRKALLKERQERRLKQIRRDLDKKLAQRNVPLRYREVSLDNFQVVDPSTQKALDRSQEFVLDETVLPGHKPGDGIFMYGPNGTGKTHLAVAIMRSLTLAGELDWYFIKAPKLLMAIRRAYKEEYAQTEEELIERFVNYKYLVIDELGVEKVSDWSLQTLYLIIDGRSDSLKSTIITSNLSLVEIKQRIEARIASRIVGMSRGILGFKCGDWRVAKRREEVQERGGK